MSREKVISFLFAAALGAAIWAFSPKILGVIEPWDAQSPYYFVSLFLSGLFVGAVVPRHFWVALVGIVAGQLIYMLVFLPKGPLLPLGLIFLGVYGVLTLFGAFLSAKLRLVVESRFERGDSGA